MYGFTGLYTDQYQLAMGQAYFQAGKKDTIAVFDYFFRKLPFEGGYAVFAGLETLLDILEGITFSDDDIRFLKSQGFHTDYINYLKEFTFRGNIYSIREGDVIFPTMPVLQVEANVIEAQIIETLLLNFLNFQSLIATKAHRMREVAPHHILIDFGMRRAQSTGSYYASRSAIIGGFDLTSNVAAGKDFGIPVSGTMAHSFIQSFDSELAAFRAFAEARPDDCVLLVDTYNSIERGIPNAITVGQEMEKKGKRLKGIRLDSGDLAYLSKLCRKMLDDAKLDYVKIAASNQLNEYLIKSLLDQKAPIDIFGVGTNLVVGEPDAALDGVYKLSWFDGKPRLKLSENIGKITLPHRKQVYRIFNGAGNFRGADVIALKEENVIQRMHHPFDPNKSMSVERFDSEALLRPVMEDGRKLYETKSLKEISEFNRHRMTLLPPEYRRFDNPHEYKIGISSELKNERDRLIKLYRS